MKITIAQLNPTIGDFNNNVLKIEHALNTAKHDNAVLVVFSELILSGYPPKDLLERVDFYDANKNALNKVLKISEKFPSIGLICGTFERIETKNGFKLYNSAVLIKNGKILFTQRKSLLPTYDVFDEKRYFTPAEHIDIVEFEGEKLGITICEDAWNNPEVLSSPQYDIDPVAILAKKGATIIINISASPFSLGKQPVRYNLIKSHSEKHSMPFVFVNQTGANDELIFDGRSMVFDNHSRLTVILPGFKEEIKTIDLKKSEEISFTPEDYVEDTYNALVLGIKDYMRKCSFKKTVIGLSGGIDSAVTCALACRAVGNENVVGVAMPSPISSESSLTDAEDLAKNLGIEFSVIPIEAVFTAYKNSLNPLFYNTEEDVTEENIQARIRGNILMALSNKFGYLVLTTGNKSELSVGYCTLYGDMSGGLAVLADIPKVLVYKIASYINRAKEVIPLSIIEKPPSAELKPGQKDQDTLPPYEILDAILELYVEQARPKKEIVERGFDSETVEWIIDAVGKNEYKRRQAPPVLKITSKAFGPGRRMPIAAKHSF